MDFSRVAAQLIVDEGLRLKPYRCPAGKLTLGVGRNLDDRGITRDEAMVMLDNDIQDFWAKLQTELPWLPGAPEPVQEALLNMCFNLGLGGLLAFKNTLALIKGGDYAGAAAAMLDSQWARQVGGRAQRLSDMVRSCAPKE